MSDKDATTPRVYLARHGETEWTLNGRYTGTTDLPLTPNGIQQVLSTSKIFIGPNKLISPSRLAHIFISPRLRAQQTFELLFSGSSSDSLPLSSSSTQVEKEEEKADENGIKNRLTKEGKVTTTDALAEWDYGAYEGLLTHEIRSGRKERGLDGERGWDIWRDGCEGGESAMQVTERLDGLIRRIREMQGPWMRGGGSGADVLLVSHGHLLRAFAKRWLGYPLEMPLAMMMEPGAVGVLSYQHHNVGEPAFLLGMGFPAGG